MRTTAYLKAKKEVYGKTITGLGPKKTVILNGEQCNWIFKYH